jgi:hypothetical protein
VKLIAVYHTTTTLRPGRQEDDVTRIERFYWPELPRRAITSCRNWPTSFPAGGPSGTGLDLALGHPKKTLLASEQ